MAVKPLLRIEVLKKYREILRVANTWKASNEVETVAERTYIREEARKLFRKNKELRDQREIQRCIAEATSRLEIALHYNNPYPRPVNFAPGFVVGSSNKKAQAEKSQQSKPIYLNSLDK